ncbi:MAG: TraB/GumN family protein [Proteobacteria bacterium]|nr:TraB/GumN family protein [Pseudomonadota bacterium]
MNKTDYNLPDSVKRVEVDGKEIFLLGTAHVSKESVEDVRKAAEALKPDTICVELCPARHKSIIMKDAWKQMNIVRVVKEKKSLFLLSQLILSSFYRRLGSQIGVQPGAEMMEGITQSEIHNSVLVLADRDIEITLKRVWGHLNFWNKMKMIMQLLMSLFIDEKIDDAMIEEMKSKDQLEQVMETFAKSFPEVKKRLIDERDIYLAQKVRNAPGKKILAIVGAGHVAGMEDYVHQKIDLEPLMEIPPKSLIPTILKWTIPALIIALIVGGMFKGGAQTSIESIYIWVLVNGILSALGAAIALAHPLTIITAFVSAPITSLNPMIATGWVSGIVQAGVKKPTVADLEDLPNATSSIKGFWTNPVSRILLVVVLANLGSSLGTFIAGSWIAMKVI